ncbi:MAG: biopolymer transporter ExbD [Casimicrobiaceae bacterium]
MRRARKAINQINVVPYIDVMLVLLVIFMITAPLVNPGQIELPSVGSQLTAPVLPLEVTLNDDKSISFRDQASKAPSVHISRDDLVAELRGKQGESVRPVVIAAAGTTRYQDVMTLLDLLQRNGIKKVGLLARPTAK